MLKVGDVVFVMHKNDIISKVLAGAMGSKWSHSGIVYGIIDNEHVLLETNDYCVNINFIERYFTDKDCSIEILRRPIDLTESEESLIKKQGRPLIGILYGYLQLLSLGLRRLINLKLKNFFRQGLVCCHVIGYSYQGIESPLKTIDPESFDTQELYEMLKSDNWIVIFKKDNQVT